MGAMIGRKPLCGPRIVQLNISDECNLDCIMCNRSCFNVKGMMDYKKAVSLIDEVYHLGAQELYYHGFGEPFLHPKIADMFKYVKNRYPKLKQFVVTNGTCILAYMVEEIFSNNVTVRFSLHAGDRKTWQRIHPKDEGVLFDRAQRTINLLGQEKPSLVEILYVLFKTNYETIERMVEFALENHVNKVLFRPMRLYEDSNGKLMNADLMLTHRQYDMVCNKVVSIKNEYKEKLSINVVPFLHNFYDEELKRPSSFEYFQNNNSCYIGWVLTVISTNGEVLGCLDESFGRPMGNVFESSFKNIWWSDNYRTFRDQQFFRGKKKLNKTACLSYCQHLGINRKLNNLRKFRIWALLQDILPVKE